MGGAVGWGHGFIRVGSRDGVEAIMMMGDAADSYLSLNSLSDPFDHRVLMNRVCVPRVEPEFRGLGTGRRV